MYIGFIPIYQILYDLNVLWYSFTIVDCSQCFQCMVFPKYLDVLFFYLGSLFLKRNRLVWDSTFFMGLKCNDLYLISHCNPLDRMETYLAIDAPCNESPSQSGIN